MGQWRVGSLLAGKRKPRPGLGVAAFSPKQPAARRRRWRRAHFGTTGLKPAAMRGLSVWRAGFGGRLQASSLGPCWSSFFDDEYDFETEEPII